MSKIYFKNNFSDLLESDDLRGKFAKDVPGMPLDDDSINTLQERAFPQRATTNAAGYDLSMPYSVTLLPGKETLVFTGVTYDVDFSEEEAAKEAAKDECDCCEDCGGLGDFLQHIMGSGKPKVNPPIARVSARSSLMKKKGLILTNAEETFKPGEYMIITIRNMTKEPVVLEKDERFAQVVFTPYELDDIPFKAEIEAVKDFNGDFVGVSPIDEKVVYFQSIMETVIQPKSVGLIKTNLKAKLDANHYLRLMPNPVLSHLYRIEMANGVGVVDADYYSNSDNDGNIGYLYFNDGYAPVSIPKGTVLGVGDTPEFFKAENEVASDTVREGGFGSTDTSVVSETASVTSAE